MSGSYGLTIKQEKFAEEYILHRNATKAYKAAGYSCKTWPDSAIWSAASRMLKNSKVAARINIVTEAAIERAEFTLEQAILEGRDDREKAIDMGQMGAAVSAHRLSCELARHIDKKGGDINIQINTWSEILEFVAADPRER